IDGKTSSSNARMPKASEQQKERVILLMMLGVLVVLIVFFSSLIVQTYREYKHFKEREVRIEQKLTQARKVPGAGRAGAAWILASGRSAFSLCGRALGRLRESTAGAFNADFTLLTDQGLQFSGVLLSGSFLN
ncbi:MAG: hypothetical protein ACPGKS_07395, partial [Coraliomargarita sp.]